MLNATIKKKRKKYHNNSIQLSVRNKLYKKKKEILNAVSYDYLGNKNINIFMCISFFDC
jgi:hypothetical protein